MDVLFCIRGCDQEDDVRRFSVRRFIIDTVRKSHGSKTGRLDSVCLSMRNSDAVADSCRALLFTGKDCSFIFSLICDIAFLGHEVDHLVDGVHFVCCASTDLNTFRFQQVSDSHTLSSSFLGLILT